MKKLKKVSSRNKILSGFLLSGLIVLGISASAFLPTPIEADLLSHTAAGAVEINGATDDGYVVVYYPVNHATETMESVTANFTDDDDAMVIAQEIADTINNDLDFNLTATVSSVAPFDASICLEEKRTGTEHYGNRVSFINPGGNLIYGPQTIILGEWPGGNTGSGEECVN